MRPPHPVGRPWQRVERLHDGVPEVHVQDEARTHTVPLAKCKAAPWPAREGSGPARADSGIFDFEHNVCSMAWIFNYIFEFTAGMAIGWRSHVKSHFGTKMAQVCNLWKFGSFSVVELLDDGNLHFNFKFKK